MSLEMGGPSVWSYFGFHINTQIGIRHFLAAWRALQSSNTVPMYRYRQEMLGLSAGMGHLFWYCFAVTGAA
jgi:hypothetical protein